MKAPIIQTYETTPSVAPVRTLENVQRGLRQMTEDHIKAQETEGKLASYRGQLMASVHESERANVAQRFDAYMENVRQNINQQSGYKGYALGDFAQAVQEVPNDYYFLGRVKSNQDYEKYITNLDEQVAKGVINEMTADRLKAENPYYYYDKYGNETEDESVKNRSQENALGIKRNGPVSGGSTWRPNSNYVKHYSLDSIVQEAYKFVSDEQGNSLSVTYLDANGKPTKDASKSVDGLWYEQKGTKYQRLSSDKLARAIKQVISSNPAYAASLSQEYKDIDYKQQKEKDSFIDNYGFFNKNGIKKSEDEYINDKINEFAELKKYNYTWTSYEQNAKAIEANNARQMALNANGVDSLDFGVDDLISSNNISFEFDITDGPKVALDGYTDAMNKMLTIADKNGDGKAEVLEEIIKNGKANYKGKEYDFDDYIASRRKAGLMSPQEEVQLRKHKAQYDDYKNYYNTLIKPLDRAGRDAIEFQNLVLNNDNDKNNIYNKQISDIFTKYGVNTNSGVKITFSDELQKQSFINATGIRNIQGLSFNIPVSDYSTFVQTASAYNSGLFGGNIEFYGNTSGISNSGYKPTGSYGDNNAITLHGNDDSAFSSIGSVYNNATNKSKSSLKKINKYSAVIYNPNLGFESFTSGNLEKLVFNGKIDPEDYKVYDKISTNQIQGAIYNGDFVNYPVYYHEGNDSGNLTYVTDSQKRRDLNQKIQHAIEKGNVKYQAGFNYKTGKAGINITVGKNEDKIFSEPGFTVFVEGLEGSKAARKFERDTDIQAATLYEQRAAYGIPYTFTGTGVPELDGVTIIPISGTQGGDLKTQQIKAISAAKAIEDLRTRANTPGYEIDPSKAWDLCKQAAINIKGFDNEETAQQIFSNIFGVTYNK